MNDKISTVETGNDVRDNESNAGALGGIAARAAGEWIPQDEERNHEISAGFVPDVQQFFANKFSDNPTIRRDQLAQMSEGDFLEIIGQTAGLLRTGRADFQHFDGHNVGLAAIDVPDQREKEQLLRETWNVARKFLEDFQKYDDEQALMYAAMTVAGGIVLVHPFADGNGRTSRVLSYVMANGAQSEEDLRGIVSKKKKVWDFYPDYRYFIHPQESEFTVSARSANDDTFAGEEEEFFARDSVKGALTASCNRFGTESNLGKFLRANEGNPDVEAIYQRHLTTDNDGKEVVDADGFWTEMTTAPGASFYAQQMLEIKRGSWSDSVESFLRGIQSDELVETECVETSQSDQPDKQASYEVFLRQNVGGKMLRRDILWARSAMFNARN